MPLSSHSSHSVHMQTNVVLLFTTYFHKGLQLHSICIPFSSKLPVVVIFLLSTVSFLPSALPQHILSVVNRRMLAKFRFKPPDFTCFGFKWKV